ncbi:MAG: hypothetical protein K2Y56_19590 [Methylobacterium sp.]|jgi:hypothetical protein|uniref:hypothetical protein n=1 Tax=Methylobacterium sp. TaxID=409 RepID=UPI0025E7DE43|nr:hypothetical protein [Methylobacterium sp.]MBX9933691.1 hypothetical protein [Methylobacterium sp.]
MVEGATGHLGGKDGPSIDGVMNDPFGASSVGQHGLTEISDAVMNMQVPFGQDTTVGMGRRSGLSLLKRCDAELG